MPIPKIAIVGRPNVGKSALFNCMVNHPMAIVDEEEGVTRDRLYGLSDLFGRPFEAIDTGGMLAKDDPYGEQIMRQAQIAIEEADAIIQVVDVRVGPQALDQRIAEILHRTKKPVVLAINKVDNPSVGAESYLFAALGIAPAICVSATHRFQIAELLQAALEKIPESEAEEVVSPYPKIAIIGRPNVGKSLLLNGLLGTDRSIVSEAAGTTRDSIDTDITVGETTYTLIDTAGIRRKAKELIALEKFAAIRTARAIERADICLLVVDCQAGVTSEEKKMARMIEEMGKGCIIALNKWDLVKHFRMEHVMKGLELEIPFLAHCPKIIISAKTGRNLPRLFPLFDTVLASLSQRIPTHKLNKALMGWMQQYHAPMIHGRRLRIYYMAQIDVRPPQFVLFVNSPLLMDASYKRYITNQLRSTFAFEGVPFILTLRGKESKARPQPSSDSPSTLDRDVSAVAHVIENLEDNDVF